MPERSGRHLGLDAIRALAIGLVVFHHVGMRFPQSISDPIGRYAAFIGWAGVDIFFAISGFLITRVLLQTSGGSDIVTFFRRRVLRIVPLYVVALLTFIALSWITQHEIESLHRLWINALFLTGWAIPILGANGVPYTISWSLSVEEFAYVLLGLVTLVGKRELLIALRVALVVALVVRLWMVFKLGTPPGLIYYFPPARIDGIAMGGLLATATSEQRITRVHWLVPLAVTLVVIGALSRVGRHNPWVATFGYSAIGISAAWLVATVARLPPSTSLLLRGAASFGLVSYFIYLFHVFVIAAAAVVCAKLGIKAPNLYVMVIAVASVTYGAALISWKYFETPLIARGHRPR